MRTGALCEKLADEDRDDARLAVGILARTVDVTVAQRGKIELLALAVEAQVVLGHHLGDAVGRRGPLRGVVGDREALGRAERRAARREYHLARAALTRLLQHVEQAHDVDLRVVDRIARRDRHRVLGGVMVHDVGLEIGEDAADRLVADVHVHQRYAVGDVGPPPAAVLPERIHDEQVVPGGEVRVDDVRADEAGSAGNDDSQNASLLAARKLWLARRFVAGDRRCRRLRSFSAPPPQYSERWPRPRRPPMCGSAWTPAWHSSPWPWGRPGAARRVFARSWPAPSWRQRSTPDRARMRRRAPSPIEPRVFARSCSTRARRPTVRRRSPSRSATAGTRSRACAAPCRLSARASFCAAAWSRSTRAAIPTSPANATSSASAVSTRGSAPPRSSPSRPAIRGTRRRGSRGRTNGRTRGCATASANPAHRSWRASCGESAPRCRPSCGRSFKRPARCTCSSPPDCISAPSPRWRSRC